MQILADGSLELIIQVMENPRGGVKYVWEFQGCFYHSCPSCFQPHNACPLTGTCFKELHMPSEEKLETLRSIHGLHTIVMREYDWMEMT